MSLSLKDLKPCAACGGQLGPVFHVVTDELATIDRRAVQEFVGLNAYFGGQAPGLVAHFAPGFDRGVVLCSDLKRDGKWPNDEPTQARHFVCQTCWVSGEKPPSSWGDHEHDDAPR